MIDLLDLHTHTMANGHVYNSLYEMAHSASAKGLSLFGCSDHTPAIPGSCHSFHFVSFKVPPRTSYGVRLMMDVELNITDYDGTMDLEQNVLEPLDCVIASLYQPRTHSGTALQNTDAYLGVLENSLIHIIGHSDDSHPPVNYDALVVVAGEHHKFLEVNNSFLNPLSLRMGARDNYIKMLELCRRHDTSIVINSDAHYGANAGNHVFMRALLEEVNSPWELIVNTSLDRLCCLLPKAAAILTQREDGRCGHLYRPVTMEGGSASGGSES